MNSKPEDGPFSESKLDSPAYRERLIRKLNCLIAVLEVACAKVRRSLAGPDPDVDRLMRIHHNLRETLDVCLRARKALETRQDLPAELPENLSQVVGNASARAPRKRSGAAGGVPAAEVRSEEERERFERLGPIGLEELAGLDLDDLARRLMG